MEISIGSYKFRVEILFLIVVVYWIMFGHVLCSCSRVGLMEGFKQAKNAIYRRKQNMVAMKGGSSMKKVKNGREGFIGSNNMAAGPEFAGAQSSGYIMDPSKWSMPTLTYSPGTTPDAGVQAIWDRPKQQIPLPEGQLDMFAKMDFKPECCPSAFSTSTGCACLDVNSYNYLRERGGNNVPYSTY